MAKVFIEETTLTAIGNAIRSKESSTDLVPVTDMATRITNLPSGGGDSGIPEEAFTISGKCSYRFAYNNWNWFVEMFGDKVHTENIDTGSNMFYQASELVEIPFDININNLSSIDNMFYGMRKLEVCPKIRGNFDPTKTVAMGAVLDYCTYLRDVEDLFTPEMLDALNIVSKEINPIWLVIRKREHINNTSPQCKLARLTYKINLLKIVCLQCLFYKLMGKCIIFRYFKNICRQFFPVYNLLIYCPWICDEYNEFLMEFSIKKVFQCTDGCTSLNLL